MAPFYTFNTKSTSIDFPWPAEISGLERIMLSAQGDLQRVMSAFFARPIIISTLFAHTYTQLAPGLPPSPLSLPNSIALASASPDHPITQTRQVQLVCADKVVCTATSTVQVTSERCARFFLEDKYPIGQMFRKLEKLPTFELLEVGLGAPTSRKGENLGSQDVYAWRNLAS
ncbi:hypothetical protein ONZ45_g17568 [Pleurotus djamor]|nr:hypothetical protein ONZ45_g17568 [Pleurotus djamor]